MKMKRSQIIQRFLSDGCSGIPDSSPSHRRCCDQHDFHYVYRGRYSWDEFYKTGKMRELGQRVSRRQADRLLRECLMANAGEDRLWANVVYYAVRLFGWVPWWRVPWWLLAILIVGAIAASCVGCTTYQVESPNGWKANISSVRKLESAKVVVGPNGDLQVELNGVDTAEPWQSLPMYIPWPYPVPPMMMPQGVPRTPLNGPKRVGEY